MKPLMLLTALLVWCTTNAQRIPVLPQIDLPHNYYYRELYLPQLTSGPSSVTWSPDGTLLVFSMNGSLWQQPLYSDTAIQLTDGDGYDYQPDFSPDGKQIIFVRYDGNSIELLLYDLSQKTTISLTANKAVNLEPRWSPDGKKIAFVSTAGTGHFLLYTATIENNKLIGLTCVTPDRKSSVKRYYYSAYDHAINPAWSKDGKKIYFISNHEIIHGTGDMAVKNMYTGDAPATILHEETSWRMKPDVSPDGTRIVYSSYLGRNWHQLWMIPADGGYPMQLTYGAYDNSSPRWSPDGKTIAFISNRDGNTALWLLDVYDGHQQLVAQSHLQYLRPHVPLMMKVLDENGNEVAARISITDSRGKFYSPQDAWIQADDARFPAAQKFESHYFHYKGLIKVAVPDDRTNITVSHGPKYAIEKLQLQGVAALLDTVVIRLKRLSLPAGTGNWWSGDVHVHMNYGGNYRNTPEQLVKQAAAEDLQVVYNLVVNKEQRIPDIDYFSTTADKASDDNVLLLHGQEFHTSYWGHLGLLHLNDHLILPDYAGYPHTGVASLFPDNTFIANRAKQQHALTGYVHPFEQSEIFPDQSPALTNELPVDAALGNVDYYELLGFSDHKASETVWYKLLNCGIRIPAAAGTDAMANYASLRGPVGLNRVYVQASGPIEQDTFEQKLRDGKSFVTNGPLLYFSAANKLPGDSLIVYTGSSLLSYRGFFRSAVPVDIVEVVWNGEVVASYPLTGSKTKLDLNGTLKVNGPGWLLLRAGSATAHPDLSDIYPYASTNPIYVTVPGIQLRSKSSGEYFLKWLDQLANSTVLHDAYRNEEERQTVLRHISDARKYYTYCVEHSTIR
ncbi:MAG: CehA/McbA family metallohydrolase [Chitinophagales bacterium]|nr:CehA/McbA family metallohydrolase [Chitinophagales bacterium]